MSAARLIAAGLVFACCGTFGLVRSARIELELKNAEALAADTERLSGFIGESRMPLREAFERLAEEGGLGELWLELSQRMDSGCSAGDAVCGAAYFERIRGGREAARELSAGLMSGEAEAVRSSLSGCAARLRTLCDARRGEIASRVKLTRSLSLLLGLAAALLML